MNTDMAGKFDSSKARKSVVSAIREWKLEDILRT